MVGATLATTVVAVPAGANAPYVLAGMYPGLAASSTTRLPDVNSGTPDFTAIYALYQHTGKGQAVINIFGAADAVTQYFANIWDARSAIPMLSYYAGEGTDTANGLHDTQLIALAQALKTYAQGPDGVLGTADDRRAYLRYGWESNNKNYAYSPCYSTPGTGFAAGWRHAHDLLASYGLDNTHVAWVFSVSSKTSPNCPAGDPALNYPGSAYVDWLGVDLYSNCGGSVTSSMFGMDQYLRTQVDSTKPLSIDEAGVWAPQDSTKNAWITDYWNYVSQNDIRMALWFNADPGPNYSGYPTCGSPQPWSVISPNHGDDVFTAWDSEQHLTSRQWHTYSAYGAGLQSSWIEANRLGVTTAQFLGQ